MKNRKRIIRKNRRQRYLTFFMLLLVVGSSHGQGKQCTDTTERIEFSMRSDFTIESYRAHSLSNNYTFSYFNIYDQTTDNRRIIMMLTDAATTILWSRELSIGSPNNQIKKILDVTQCKNGSLALLGVAYDPYDAGIYKILLIRVDVSGTILGVSAFTELPRPGRQLGLIDDYHLKELDNEDIVLTYHVDGGNLPATLGTIVIARIQPDNSVAWSKAYELDISFFSLGVVHNQESVIIPFYSSLGSFAGKYSLGFLKLNSTDGNLQATRTYSFPSLSLIPGWITYIRAGSVELSNGNFAGILNHEHKSAIHFVFDSSLNILKSHQIKTTSPTASINRLYLHRDGFLFGSSVSQTDTENIDNFHFVIDSLNQLVSQRHINFSSSVSPNFYSLSDMVLDGGNKLQFFIGFKKGNQNKIQLLKRNIYNTDSSCWGPPLHTIDMQTLTLEEVYRQPKHGPSNFISSLAENYHSFDNPILQRLLCRNVKQNTLDLGKDFSICKFDTTLVKANAGFDRYRWQAPYLHSYLNDSTITVLPAADSFYTVEASTKTGCTLKDTLAITLKNTPLIDLGPDTSLCKGSSIFFSAGNNFIGYRWNTGDTTPDILAQEAGKYFVKARYPNGCYESDTIEIKFIHELPNVGLSQTELLCYNQTDTLKANPGYVRYTWSNGHTQRDLKIDTPGTYWVRVSDANGCSNTDSVTIKKIAPLPFGFAPPDTAVCSYETIQVKSFGVFYKYTWSDGGATPSITIRQPGVYWLQVTDSNGCYAKETFKVGAKNCQTIFSIPNAFTPDGNGRNDFFGPVIKGAIENFSFSVFNRWGQLVFFTTDPSKRWDGTLKGKKADAGTYTWLCIYQLTGEPKTTQKGNVVLLR